MIDCAALASSVISFLRPLLYGAIKKGFDKAGERSAEALVAPVMHKLQGAGLNPELDLLAEHPTDESAREALETKLVRAFTVSPELAIEIKNLIANLRPSQIQNATAAGQSTVVQIQGSGNDIDLSPSQGSTKGG
jgi:hypothetical protein